MCSRSAGNGDGCLQMPGDGRHASTCCAIIVALTVSVDRSGLIGRNGGHSLPSIQTRPEGHYAMNDVTKQTLTKVPAVTLGFWVIKILATTLGETGGDAVTMTIFHADTHKNWGYLIGVALFGGALVALVVAQIFAKRFHPALYWATIVASTTFGTTLADFADRSLGIGYTGGSLLLLCCLLATLGLWYWSQGTVSVNTVSTPKVVAFS